MSAGELLNETQKKFAEAYHDSKSITESYRYAYPKTNYNSAGSCGSRLLKDARIQDYLTELDNKDKAYLAIINGDNKRRLTAIVKDLQEFSMLLIDGLKDKAPRTPEERKAMTANEYRTLAQASATIGASLKDTYELSTQLTGACEIAQEIFDKIKDNKWAADALDIDVSVVTD